MSNKIKHDGIIDSIAEGKVRVRIVQTAACAACKVAKHCNASESKEKLVDVFTTDTSRWTIGEQVVVAASQQMANKALAFAFGIPLLLLLLVLVIALKITGSEGIAALCGILALVPYFMVLFVLRSSLQRQMSFWIEEK
ncbi:MAG: SoxR reducing system RseC family protein [Prevotella sp.]|nr:SoxR reducing system RseC family protein [Prevotella sp.]